MAASNPLLAIPLCAIGAPLVGLAVEIISADKTSKYIKAAGITAFFNPVLGGIIAGIGALVAPTKLYIDEHWNADWKNKTIMLPWGIEKKSVHTYTLRILF